MPSLCSSHSWGFPPWGPVHAHNSPARGLPESWLPGLLRAPVSPLLCGLCGQLPREGSMYRSLGRLRAASLGDAAAQRRPHCVCSPQQVSGLHTPLVRPSGQERSLAEPLETQSSPGTPGGTAAHSPLGKANTVRGAVSSSTWPGCCCSPWVPAWLSAAARKPGTIAKGEAAEYTD